MSKLKLAKTLKVMIAVLVAFVSLGLFNVVSATEETDTQGEEVFSEQAEETSKEELVEEETETDKMDEEETTLDEVDSDNEEVEEKTDDVNTDVVSTDTTATLLRQPRSSDGWELHYDAAWRTTTSSNYSSSDTFEIYTAEEFAAFAYMTSNYYAPFTGKTIKLMNDIDISAYTWLPIAYNSDLSFAGTFDGGGNTISGMRLSRSVSTNSAGDTMNGTAMFRFVYGGTIKNLVVENATIDQQGSSLGQYETNHVGIVAGAARGATFENITVKDSTMNLTNINCDGWNTAGMLVGSLNWNYDTTPSKVVNCTSVNSTVNYSTSGGGYLLAIGGLVGGHGSDYGAIGGPGSASSASSVHDSNVINFQVNRTSAGTNVTWEEAVGGLVGRTNAVFEIVDCTATYEMDFTGSFTATGFRGISAGGVVGSIDGGAEVLRCSAVGSITANATGGLASRGLFAGGIAGQAGNWGNNSRVYGSTIKSCFSSMDFTGANSEEFGNVIGLRIKPLENYSIDISEVFCLNTGVNDSVSGITSNANGTLGTINERDVYFIDINDLHVNTAEEPFTYTGIASDGTVGVIDNTFVFAYSDADATGTITDNSDGTVTGTLQGNGFNVGGNITRTSDAEVLVKFILPVDVLARTADYAVTKTATNASISGADSIAPGATYTASATADSGYDLPDTITVTMNGTSLVQETGFTFDKTTGAISIPNVNGDLVITVNGVAKVPEKYSVTYHKNNATSGNVPVDANQYLANATATVMNQGSLVREGYTFNGWNTSANGSGTAYAVNKPIIITGNVTLYAQWKINTYTITYDANGGSGSNYSVSANYSSSHTVLASSDTNLNYVHDNYEFKGWNTKADGSGAVYSVNDMIMITGNVTLYAQWSEKAIVTPPTQTTASYKVEHYLQQTDGTYIVKEVENKTGTIGSSVSASYKTYTGYVSNTFHINTKLTGTVADDGSLTLRLYYKAIGREATFNPSTNPNGSNSSASMAGVNSGDNTNTQLLILLLLASLGALTTLKLKKD